MKSKNTDEVLKDGMRFAAAGASDDAISAFRSVIALEPDHAEAHQELGLTLYRKGLSSEALECFERALRIRPELRFARLGLAAVLDRLGKSKEAEACYEELTRSGKDALAFAWFGDFLVRNGDLPRAEQCFKAALQVDSKCVPALRDYGRMLASVARSDEAEGMLREALLLDPDDTFSQYAYGRFLSESPGRMNEALLHLRNAAAHGEQRAEKLIAQLEED